MADFGGQCAGQVLFEREGLSRSFEESRESWQGFTHSLAYRSSTRVWDARGNGDGNIAPTITGDHNNRVTDYTTLCVRERCGKEGGGKGCLVQENKTGSIVANNDQFFVVVGADLYNQGQNAQFDIGIDDSGIAHTLVAKGPGAVAYGVEIGDRIVLEVRRATPTECGRLQGMPDWWCEDVPHSDTAEYKMWGNGMALPNVLYVMEGVVSLLSVRLLNSILEVSG